MFQTEKKHLSTHKLVARCDGAVWYDPALKRETQRRKGDAVAILAMSSPEEIRWFWSRIDGWGNWELIPVDAVAEQASKSAEPSQEAATITDPAQPAADPVPTGKTPAKPKR